MLQTHPNGLDFYFGQRNHAIKFLSFLSSVAPVRTNASERLISQDIQNNKMRSAVNGVVWGGEGRCCPKGGV